MSGQAIGQWRPGDRTSSMLLVRTSINKRNELSKKKNATRAEVIIFASSGARGVAVSANGSSRLLRPEKPPVTGTAMPMHTRSIDERAHATPARDGRRRKYNAGCVVCGPVRHRSRSDGRRLSEQLARPNDRPTDGSSWRNDRGDVVAMDLSRPALVAAGMDLAPNRPVGMRKSGAQRANRTHQRQQQIAGVCTY